MRSPKRRVTSDGEVFFTGRYRNPPSGPRRSLAFYGNTEAAALSDANEFVGLLATVGVEKAVKWWNEHLDREPGDRALTLDQWWPRYLASLTGVTDGTRDSYDRIYKREWKPKLGAMPLTAIGRDDVAGIINRLSRAGKSDKTIRNVSVVLTSCLKVAREDGHIPALPTRGIRLPRNTDHESDDMRFLTYDEWDKVHGKLPAHYRPLFTFLIGTGCRYGEAEALTVGDVFTTPFTLESGDVIDRWQVRVVKAAKWNATSRTRTVGPTKTRKGRRTITLPPEVIVELAPLLGGRAKTERLFLAVKGGPIRHKPVYDVWVKACKDAGLDPRPRMHDLRHTHVAWLIAAGVSLPVVQARLGHEQITTTIDTYGHLLPELEAAATEAASLAMRPRRELSVAD